jgi:DNA-directed RNA polymerase specialized sigma24 family protein
MLIFEDWSTPRSTASLAREREDDLVDKIMAAALEKILTGEPRDASRLVAYVCGICSNLTKTEMRPRLKQEQPTFCWERIGDGAQTVEDRLLAEERAAAVRRVLCKLGRRDQAVLVDLFYFELEREEICRKHRVTKEQLRLVLFHARRRFQKVWCDVK